MAIIPHLFYITHERQLILIATKIFEDILIAGMTPAVEDFLRSFNEKFKLEIVAHGARMPTVYRRK